MSTAPKYLAAILASLLLSVAAQAAPVRWAGFSNPVFRHYGQNDGLPSPVATAIAEDGEGFIWVGTEGGLARWDGYRFQVYKPTNADSTTLPDAWITTLHADARGRLWIGTSAGGLTRFDSEREQFVTYRAGVNGLSNVHVSSIADDGLGGLWIATEGGLDHLDSSLNNFQSFHHTESDPNSLPDDRVLSVLLDRDGNLWVGTRGGLAVKAKGEERFAGIALYPPPGGLSAAKAIAVCSLFEDAVGRIWAGTTNHGAFTIEKRERVGHPIMEMAGGAGRLQQQWVYSIAEPADGVIWLGTYGQGIVAVDEVTGHMRRIRHDQLRPYSLADDTMWAMHRDKAGGLWVGTTVGLSRLIVADNSSILTVAKKSIDTLGLSEDNVPSVLAATNGQIWAGLRSAGIDILDPDHGTVVNIPVHPNTPDTALPDSFVFAMAEWADGNVYAGTSRGLYLINEHSHEVSRQHIRGRDPAARNTGLLVSGGKLWIAGSDDGVWVLDPTLGSHALIEHFDAGQLTDRRATTFVEDRDGAMWIGTRNGLNRLDSASRHIDHLLPDPSNPAALSAGYMSSLLLDRAGRLWVGTMGGGIQVLVGGNAAAPVFRHLRTADGLPDDNVDSLELDASGQIWAATDEGLARIDPETFTIQSMHRADGVLISAYWIGARARTPAGEILFGGPGGLTIVKPDEFKRWSYRPPIVITQKRVAGHPILGQGLSLIDGVPSLAIRAHGNSFAVEFAALDYSSPMDNRYQYRLDGFDEEWMDTDATRRLAAYTNLPPGRFTLRLRGSNRERLWSERSLDLPIRVLPTWYQTIYFKLASMLAACVVILALIQGRTLFLRRRQRELEHEVAERTSELEASKRQIEQIAYHDALTGLGNRRLFTDDLNRLSAVAERSIRRFALMLIDLDEFKQVNDKLGHDAGDAVLVEAAKRLKATVRVSDRLSRLGGDEFAILLDTLPGTPTADAVSIEALCLRVLESFSGDIRYKGVTSKTSVSIGIAIFPDDADTAESLYKAADLALYDAKRCGRNTWRWHANIGLVATAS